MAVTSFKDFDLTDADREWDGDAAEKRVRKWADAEDEPNQNQKYRDTHVWYDADNKDNFTAYKLLICDVVKGKLVAVPRGVMAAGGVMQGARGGVDIPDTDVDRVKSHLAKYYRKMDRTPPWED
jgi:hypothetical protein